MTRISTQVPSTINHFGALLKYLRRRARITQRELSIEVGYSEVHISRLEGTYRPPDQQTLLALFVPALDLHDAPELVTRLLELAHTSRQKPLRGDPAAEGDSPAAARADLEAVPLPPTGNIVRSDVLQRLRQRLAHDRVVIVSAQPGMGKTTLAAALAREDAGARPIFWLTLTAGVTTSVAALVRQLALFLLAHGQTQVQALLPQGNTASGELRLDEKITLLNAALTRLTLHHFDRRPPAYAGPPLLCFDNVHLIQHDPALIQVLSHLVTASPCALLLLSREQLPLPCAVAFQLDGLERREGRFLIGQLHPDLAQALVERLLDKTGGNPLLLRLALGMLDQSADHAHVITDLEHTQQIADVLDATVRQLSVPATDLLALIAVFRQPVNVCDPALLDLLQPANGSTDFGLARSELQRRRLLDHPTQAALHPLLREHVYAGLASNPQQSQRLHELAALWSARVTNDIVEAAHHYAAASNIEAAGELLSESYQSIRRQGRGFAAVEVIDNLLKLVRQHSRSADTTRQLFTLRADLLVGTQRAAEAEANYRAALQLVISPTLRAPLVARLAESLVQRGQAKEAVTVCVAARESLGAAHPLLLAQLFIAESHAQLILANYDAALHTAGQALAQVVPIEHAAPQATAEIRALAYKMTAAVFHNRQQFEQAAFALEHSVIAARQGDLKHLIHLAQIEQVRVYFALGDLESAIAVSQATIPPLQVAHDSYALEQLLGFTGLSYLMHGDLAIALEVTEQASTIAEAIGDTDGLTDSRLRRARILIAHGRIQEAHALVERLLAAPDIVSKRQLYGYVFDRLAMIQLLRGDAATALTTFEHALVLSGETSDRKLRADLHNHRALALLVIGDDAAAARTLAIPSAVRLPTSTILTHRLIDAMLVFARGDDPRTIATAIAADADATTHYLFSRAAHRLIAAANAPPQRAAFPQLHWVETPLSLAGQLFPPR